MNSVPETAELIGENLACRRGERVVFRGVDFRLPPGGALMLRGPNGSGKSSLLRLLATLLVPAAGRLVCDGVPVSNDPARYRALIHYVGHLDAVKAALTPRQMLGFWAALRGAQRPAIEAALAAFGIERAADWPCRWLSAGQRRRLALARLIAAPAPIWLLDEPGAALDRDGMTQLDAAIAAHRALGGSIALATHEAAPIANAATLQLDAFAAAPQDLPAI